MHACKPYKTNIQSLVFVCYEMKKRDSRYERASWKDYREYNTFIYEIKFQVYRNKTKPESYY